MANFGKAVKKTMPINWFRYSNEDAMADLIQWTHRFVDDPYEIYEISLSDDSTLSNLKSKLKIKISDVSSLEVPNGYIIIREINGDFSICDPDGFEGRYEIK